MDFNSLTDLYIDNKKVDTLYLNNKLVWDRKLLAPLTFTAKEANSTIMVKKQMSPTAISLEYSVDDGNTWNVFTVGTTVVTLANIGDSV